MKSSAVESVKREIQREKASRVVGSQSSEYSQQLGLKSRNFASLKKVSND